MPYFLPTATAGRTRIANPEEVAQRLGHHAHVPSLTTMKPLARQAEQHNWPDCGPTRYALGACRQQTEGGVMMQDGMDRRFGKPLCN